MPRSSEPPMEMSRLTELAQQADRQGRCRFTPFLTPPEAELAEAAARRSRVSVALWGGYDDAERRMARFCPSMAEEADFPLQTLLLTWPHQEAPAHRDLLGAIMGLGVKRACLGDIVVEEARAYVFAEEAMARVIADSLCEAGRVHLGVELLGATPELAAPEGEEIRFTVQSPRLDAIIADGFHLSRGKAAELIEAGAVKLRHRPTLRSDAKVEPGDAISVRGFGRLLTLELGEPTRKGRLPVRMQRFGAVK